MLSRIPATLAAAGLLGLFFAGCATVTRGTKDVLVVESEPAGAKITISNGLTGTTPASFTLPRKEALVVTLEMDGYEKVQVNVKPVLVGGFVGAAVDVGTGSMRELVPNPVHVKLFKIEAAVSAPAPETGQKTAEERLSDLKDLLDKGVINQEEYDAQRTKILSGI
ncbi:MAG: hypothetical protein A3G75_01875 [Verrucomicrobia bacterium RIFCSPLOWO2_12_FULL_64_8]|nr:MAG: hypothetical protein A3G75_01875 [Verrucomicrobia bacterium RIFCSPLOWO2_12_FULL_64_8]